MSYWKCYQRIFLVLFVLVKWTSQGQDLLVPGHQRDAPLIQSAGNCPPSWGYGCELGGLPGCAVGEEMAGGPGVCPLSAFPVLCFATGGSFKVVFGDLR